MTMEEMLAKIIVKLEETNALLRSAAEQPTPSSPPSTYIFPTDTEEREASASTMSTKPATTSLASLVPSPTSASPQDADPGFSSGSGVTEVSYIHHTPPDPPVSIDGDFCVPFDADARGTDRLSRLPDPLLRDIVSRLPLKDAARTSVLSHRWSPIWRAAPLIVDPVDLAVVHLNPNHCCDQVPGRLAGCWSRSTCSSMDAALDSQIGVTRLFIASPTRCSMLGLYQVVTTLMPVITFWASLISTAMLLVGATITKHLHATLPTNINHRKGNKIPKPPWLLDTKVFRSWSRKMQLLSGFLLEVSPWCRDYMMWVQLQPSMMLLMQLQKASRGRPVVLHFICGNGGKFLLQPWPPQLVIVKAEHHQLKLKSQREINGQFVQIRNCAVKLEEGNNKLNIFLLGTDMNFHQSCNIGVSLFNIRSCGLLHTFSHGGAKHNIGSLVLPMTKSKENVVSMADQKGIHSLFLMHGHLFLWELDGNGKNVQAALLLMSSWPLSSCRIVLMHFCVSNLPVQLRSMLMGKCLHGKFWECEKFWGTYELSIPMGDMSLSASEITVLNPHEVDNKNSSPKFGLSKLGLLLLLGKHFETSSCQVSVEHIPQWSPPKQNKFRSMLVELEKSLEHLAEMSMKAKTELFAGLIGMENLYWEEVIYVSNDRCYDAMAEVMAMVDMTCRVLLVLDKYNIHSSTGNFHLFQLWPTSYILWHKIHFKLLLKCTKSKHAFSVTCSAQNFSGLAFILVASMFLRVQLEEHTSYGDILVFDPGGFLINLQAMLLALVDCHGHIAMHINWCSIFACAQLVIQIHVALPKQRLGDKPCFYGGSMSGTCQKYYGLGQSRGIRPREGKIWAC